MTWRMLAVSVLSTACLSLFAAIPWSHAEVTPSTYKWVDANNDCRSICDASKYACPCVIL